jgi:sporulation protein YlmC with PRC-barrel domain
MRFSECRKRPVLDLASAQQIGRVDGFAVDAVNRRIHAVLVAKHDAGSVLRWADVQGFGPDAVTVSSPSAIGAPSDPLDGAGDLRGSRVLSDRGFDLGTVADVEFDPATGQVLEVVLGDRSIPGGDLRGYGSYAVVVRHPAEVPER